MCQVYTMPVSPGGMDMVNKVCRSYQPHRPVGGLWRTPSPWQKYTTFLNERYNSAAHPLGMTYRKNLSDGRLLNEESNNAKHSQ